MITVDLSPSEFSLSKNPIPLGLSTDNQYSQQGEYAVYDLVFSSTPSPNDTFDIQFGDSTVITFTFNNVSNDSGLRLSYAGTLPENAESVAYSLTLNYYINKYFDISVVGSKVRFTAKNYGLAYMAILDNEPGYLSLSGVTTGADRIERPNFKILLRIARKYTSSDDWSYIEREVKPVDGAITVDLSENLDLETWSNLLPNPSVDFTVHSDCIPLYQISYAEQYGTPPVQRAIRSEAICYFISGGIGNKEHELENFANSWIANSRTILSRSTQLDIYKDETHYLSYMHIATSQSVQIVIQETHQDGSVSVHELPLSNVTKYDVITFKIDPSDVFVDTSNTRSFKLWISTSTDPDLILSQILQFNFQNAASVDRLQLIYENGLGFFDSINLRGVQTHSLPTSKEEQKVYGRIASDYAEHSKQLTSREMNYEVLINSGYINKNEVERIGDILMSSRVFVVKGDSTLLPVEVEAQSDTDLYTSRTGRLNNVNLVIKSLESNNYEPNPIRN